MTDIIPDSLKPKEERSKKKGPVKVPDGQKIVGAQVFREKAKPKNVGGTVEEVIGTVHHTDIDFEPPEPFERPAGKIPGVTYKIRPPTMNAALYVTINDIDIGNEEKRPVEIFLASKDVAHQEWIVALSRMISGLFRQPYDFTWVIDELRQVYDPKGGYFIPGTKIMCGGVVAHIGYIIEQHCKDLGIIEDEKLSTEEAGKLLAKAKEAENKGIPATECPDCHKVTAVFMDGCWTCTNCGYSKCG